MIPRQTASFCLRTELNLRFVGENNSDIHGKIKQERHADSCDFRENRNQAQVCHGSPGSAHVEHKPGCRAQYKHKEVAEGRRVIEDERRGAKKS